MLLTENVDSSKPRGDEEKMECVLPDGPDGSSRTSLGVLAPGPDGAHSLATMSPGDACADGGSGAGCLGWKILPGEEGVATFSVLVIGWRLYETPAEAVCSEEGASFCLVLMGSARFCSLGDTAPLPSCCLRDCVDFNGRVEPGGGGGMNDASGLPRGTQLEERPTFPPSSLGPG